jgi:cyclopropane fatty-acyl-phospholipid synthase-like methyltransferase
MQPTYFPGIFNVNDIPQAMQIILAPEGSSSTDERWKTETPYVANLINDSLAITNETIIVDYGCGIGRMAKELITRHGCRVVGVDISPSMRALAVIYVQSDHFFACSPLMLDAMIDRGFRFDAAISIWVLQHCYQPRDDIARIRNSLKADGRLFVLNTIHRLVPAVEREKFNWCNDSIDIKSMLAREFEREKDGRLPREIPGGVTDLTFWASFRQRGSV